jgi:UDP-3-O-[3-hydroxymyristoyl] glucosamine N-acyltransferase
MSEVSSLIQMRCVPVGVPIGVPVRVLLCPAAVASGADSARPISGIGSLERAGPGDVAFIDSPRYVEALAHTRAGACFTS